MEINCLLFFILGKYSFFYYVYKLESLRLVMRLENSPEQRMPSLVISSTIVAAVARSKSGMSK